MGQNREKHEDNMNKSLIYDSSPTHPNICISLNVLNTGILTMFGEGVNVAVIWTELMLDVCVNVHFTLVHREGSVLESVRATGWQTR